MNRKLASIQRVDSISPIEGADKIEQLKIMGYTVVSQKGTFAVGDPCIFFEVDSVLPIADWHGLPAKDGKHPRIKAMKIRGVVSEGFAIPADKVNSIFNSNHLIGCDVTEVLCVTHYDPPEDVHLGGDIVCPWPENVQKTDEIRLQSVPEFFDLYRDMEFVGTEKLDGCSATFTNINGEFMACSRNCVLKDGDNIYWKMAHKFGLPDIMHGTNLTFQGEIVGPKINGNRYKLTEHRLYLFNVVDGIRRLKLADLSDSFLFKRSIKAVPCVYSRQQLLHKSIEDIVAMSDRRSALNPDIDIEGIVWRSLDERVSFKVLNQSYLLEKEKVRK